MELILSDSHGELYTSRVIPFLDFLEKNGTTVQTIITDPPYNIGKADWDKFNSTEDYLEWCMDWVSQSGTLLNNEGSLFIMGFSEILADIKYRIAREIDWVNNIDWLVWHYKNKPQMQDKKFTRSHESILWITKDDDYKLELDRIRIPYNSHTEKYPVREQGQTSLFGSEEEYEWDPDVEGAKPRDVIDVPTVNNASSERTSHPTQKPEELFRKIVWATTDKNDTVCDPFGGSGTTYSVCKQLGRKWIGSEINEEYQSIIMERLDNIEEVDNPSYWKKHDMNRREHRREIRYGKDN